MAGGAIIIGRHCAISQIGVELIAKEDGTVAEVVKYRCETCGQEGGWGVLSAIPLCIPKEREVADRAIPHRGWEK